MTMDVHSTDGFEEELVEFALGILDGRARAVLVEHVEHCGDCAERLAQLSTTADLLMYVPVGAEPPLGVVRFQGSALVPFPNIMSLIPDSYPRQPSGEHGKD